MRQLRTILRLRLQAKLSLRQIKTSLRLSLGAVQKICSKAEALDLDWPAIEQLDDQQLASRFYPRPIPRFPAHSSSLTGQRSIGNSNAKE